MLSNFKEMFKLTSQVLNKCEFHRRLFNEKLLLGSNCGFNFEHQKYNFHTDPPRNKHINVLESRRAQRDATSKVFVNEPFEDNLTLKRKEGFFPAQDLSENVYNGILFKNLPIVYIKISRNNTILTLNVSGKTILNWSCGKDGFKNSKKGTNIAAQTSGISFGMRAIKKGYKTVRVLVGGLGPGRLSSIKGLQLAGVEMVSITDKTIDHTSMRPRKQRRL